MRIVAIGDPHITNNFDIFDRVVDKALSLSPDMVVILGDLFHTHSVIKAEVFNYWMEKIRYIKERTKLVIIRGNHDAPHDKVIYDKVGPIKFLSSIFNDESVIVANHIKTFSSSDIDLLFMPFFYTEQEMESALSSLPINTQKFDYIFCHQTFEGGMYQNGFYAPDAFKIDFVQSLLKPNGKIVSGHLHAKQQFGPVVYVGTPMWLTRSDLDSDKFILEIDAVNKELKWHSVSDVVPRPYSYTVRSIEDAQKVIEELSGKKLSSVYFTIELSKEEELKSIRSLLGRHFPDAKMKVNIKKESRFKELGSRHKSFYEWIVEQIGDAADRDEVIKVINRFGDIGHAG